jgi:predicted phosphohydrolase
MTTQTQNPAYRPAPPSLADSPAPRIWALGDTHLGAGVGKSMDRFGPHWQDHARRIVENAWRVVGQADVLLLAGDLSWATKRRDAEPDLALLTTLPGRKIAIKGNHDYWWDSGKPIGYAGLENPPILLPGDIGIAGTRGWFSPEAGAATEEADRKIFERERERLRASLYAIAECSTKIALLHYPPQPYLPELTAAGVTAAVYGHIHLGSFPADEVLAFDGDAVEGIRLFCVAADRVDFTPRRIL